MPLRGNEFWLAREFILLWEKDVIRSLPTDCGDAELPAILAFREKYAPRIQAIVGTIDEWLQLREHLRIEELAF